MISKVSIKNFKSVEHLELDLGRFNVFIGENGCGKSNVLEAIAMGSAASADKLDRETLETKGIRITENRFFKSAFSDFYKDKPVELKFIFEKDKNEEERDLKETGRELNFGLNFEDDYRFIWKDVARENFIEETAKFFTALSDLGIANDSTIDIEKIKNFENSDFFKKMNSPDIVKHENFSWIQKHLVDEYKRTLDNASISSYKIFSPENSSLRKFEDDYAAWPLGITGGGLWELLNSLKKNAPEDFQRINEKLYLIEWFGGFDIPDNLAEGERRLGVIDKYLDSTTKNFTHRSTNEGFLFLLFYITLFVSKDTPSFFAIDNIEASFHPKLCKKMIQELVVLSKEHNKQALTTTHNPFILDGLDLNDPEQRLFVVYRNKEGKTKVRRIEAAERDYELSYAWINGFLGGVPNNFTV
jgi:predicted ATPase